MTIAHVRDLSKYGVLADVNPFNLPPEAFSAACNARFQNGSVLRAPVFRRVPFTLQASAPRFVASNISNSGFDSVILGYLNGRVTSYKSGVETNISIGSYADADAEAPFTSCHLGDVFYVNRGDRVPWYLRTTDTQFQALGSGWDATWRAKILRSCNSALCAFGITEGATVFPTKIRTSEFAQVNNVPSTWDAADPTSNATANILSEMEGAITDANNMGDIIIIYGLNETWTMTPVGGASVWEYKKLFNDAGAINANCSIELNRQHYVFGANDIWVHDGNSKKSIIDGKNRRFLFGSMNLQKARYFHVVFDRNRNELRFNYVGGDQLVAFTAPATGCNRSAVLNLTEGTWTFDDLPLVFGGAMANLDTTLTYNTVTSTYDTIGGSYIDQDDSLKKVLCMVGDVSATFGLTKSLYAVDNQGPGSLIAYAVDTAATRPATLRRDGMDLDGLPELADLRGYKVVSSIYPQAQFEPTAQPLQFSFGSADHFNDPVVFSAPQTYDGVTDVRCDYYEAGRYLSLLIVHNDYHYFELTGIDLDLRVDGAD